MHRSRRIAALVVLVVALFTVPAMAGDLTPGDQAPDFTLTDSAGENHTLSDYKGKIVVLEWTNPQCPFVVNVYGNDSMLPLASWAQKEGVVWLTIDSSYFVTAASAQKWAESNKMKQPILLDATGMVGKMYDAKTTPNMFVINAEGVLVYSGAFDNNPKPTGVGDVNYVRRAITATMNGAEPETAQTKPYGCSVKYAKKETKEKAAS